MTSYLTSATRTVNDNKPKPQLNSFRAETAKAGVDFRLEILSKLSRSVIEEDIMHMVHSIPDVQKP